jgi:hypothetical protein
VMQFGTGLLTLEDGELLAKSSCFQSGSVAWQQERAEVSDHRVSKDNHHFDLS